MKATYTITVKIPARRGIRETLRDGVLRLLIERGEDRAVLRSVRVKRS